MLQLCRNHSCPGSVVGLNLVGFTAGGHSFEPLELGTRVQIPAGAYYLMFKALNSAELHRSDRTESLAYDDFSKQLETHKRTIKKSEEISQENKDLLLKFIKDEEVNGHCE